MSKKTAIFPILNDEQRVATGCGLSTCQFFHFFCIGIDVFFRKEFKRGKPEHSLYEGNWKPEGFCLTLFVGKMIG